MVVCIVVICMLFLVALAFVCTYNLFVFFLYVSYVSFSGYLLSESALREEVVRNYKAFMHATEEIRTMEAGIQTLKDLLGSTADTLQVQLTFLLL